MIVNDNEVSKADLLSLLAVEIAKVGSVERWCLTHNLIGYESHVKQVLAGERGVSHKIANALGFTLSELR